MKLKVSVEELMDRGAIEEYCAKYELDKKKLMKEKHDEVYINEVEAEKWGFMGPSRDLFGGGK